MYVKKNYSSMIVIQGDTTPRIFPSVTLRKDFPSVTLVTEGFFFYKHMLQMVVQVMKEVRMRNLHDLSFPELILVSRYNSVNSFTCFHRNYPNVCHS